MISLADFQPRPCLLLKSALFHISTAGVLQKDISVTKSIPKKERQMKLTRFIFSRRFEVIVTPLSSDKYLQVLEFK